MCSREPATQTPRDQKKICCYVDKPAVCATVSQSFPTPPCPATITEYQDQYLAAVDAKAKGMGPVLQCGEFEVTKNSSFPKCTITVGTGHG